MILGNVRLLCKDVAFFYLTTVCRPTTVTPMSQITSQGNLDLKRVCVCVCLHVWCVRWRWGWQSGNRPWCHPALYHSNDKREAPYVMRNVRTEICPQISTRKKTNNATTAVAIVSLIKSYEILITTRRMIMLSWQLGFDGCSRGFQVT